MSKSAAVFRQRPRESTKVKADSGTINILNYKRPAGSFSEEQCIKKYIDIIPGIQIDSFKTIFSCHTDTVHKTAGMQKVFYDTVLKQLFTKSGECLGADDGAGMIIMLHMIENKIPGMYIFHREEECGGGGSSYIAQVTPDLIEGYERCIAFDRRGTGSVITHQLDECCSDKFAIELGKQLGWEWLPDETGIFTDSANYIDLIPECTNLSCGYELEHTPNEYLNMRFFNAFKEKILKVDWENLGTYRDPIESASRSYYYGYSMGGYITSTGGEYYPAKKEMPFTKYSTTTEVYNYVKSNPWSAAEIIKELLW